MYNKYSVNFFFAEIAMYSWSFSS